MTSQQLGHTNSVTEVVIQLTDSTYPFVGVSQTEDCEVSLVRMLPHGAGEYSEFFSISGADPDRVVELAGANEHVRKTRLLSRNGNSGLFEFIVSTEIGACPAQELAELGAIPREITASGGKGRVTVEILPSDEPSEIVSAFLEDYPDAEMISKRQKRDGFSLFTENEIKGGIDGALTDRQKEVMLTAYEGGYYDFPRGKTGEELADELDIAQPTFCEILRTSERKMIGFVYDQCR